jgi:hypothetical protein
MGSRIQCFLIEPTNRTERKLRRYRFSSDGEGKCPGKYGYHNGHTDYGEGRCHEETTDGGHKVWKWDEGEDMPPKDDPRWAKTCDDCSYVFRPQDEWQVFREVIYVRKDSGALMTLRDCPPGAMWDADWYPDKGGDGHSWCVCLPPGNGDYWNIDGYAKGGGKWTRTGEAPNLTASPSILTPRYHGFLRNGFLEEC